MLRRKFTLLVAISIVIMLNSCAILNNPTKIKSYAKIETSEGLFVIGLYEGTPLHKENFLSNCSSQIYDSTLIYSTIPNGIHKMGLKPGKKEEYTLSRTYDESKIKCETHPKLLNKRGAVGMLRLSTDENPELKSDNFLFYLVEGIKTDKKLLHTLEAKRNAPIIADYITVFISETGNEHYDDSLRLYKGNSDHKNYRRLYVELTEKVKPRIESDGINLFKLNEEQIKLYTEFGGVPIYDGKYTIFGEIVYGEEILNTLSNIKTGLKNKPKKKIYIISSIILTKKEFKKFKSSNAL